ncbi:MAG: hypothetical protein GXO83_01910 [Chlorobi bacterium]|nr:hypothetical protein [Chlorobiota bacterium]
MHIIADHITTRLKYILDYVLTVRLGIPYRIHRVKDNITSADEQIIFYTKQKPGYDRVLWIPATGLLNETGIRTEKPDYGEKEEIPFLFPVNDPADIPFDLFSAVFWFLTRYEEYVSDQTDEHGRFPAEANLAVRQGFSGQPVVDFWIRWLRTEIKKRYPDLQINTPGPFFRLTVDVDQAYAIRHKGWLRTGAGLLRALAVRTGITPRQYVNILAGKEHDPFDTFSQLVPEESNENFQIVFFFHTGIWGKRDKSIPVKNKAMQQVIRQCQQRGRVGLHPSYRVMDQRDLLEKEKQRLETVTGKPVISARFHYIRFRVPGSYRLLLQNGITEDYSMGWPEITGFRAGTAHPFPWYDLEKEEITPLTIYPFPVMDGVLKDRGSLTPTGAVNRLEMMIDTLADIDAPFIPLWHNHALSETDGWQGWRDVYQTMIGKAMERYSL